MSIEGFFIVGLIVVVGVLAWCFIQVLIIEIQLQRDMRRIEEKSALAKDLKGWTANDCVRFAVAHQMANDWREDRGGTIY